MYSNNRDGMRIFRHISLLLLSFTLLTVACVREPLPEAEGTAGAWDIAFCASPSADVVVSTKGTMTKPSSENVVFNLYVLVFDDNNNKVFGQYFDYNNLTTGNSWTKPNQWKYDVDQTSGKVHLTSAKSASSGSCKIVAIANLNSEMVNITPEQLDHVSSYTDMQNLAARLLQEITSRSGYFPMCGMIENVDLSQDSFNTTGKVLSLKRLDAKIQFNVRVKTDVPTDTENRCFIYDFTPLTWQVFNVPKHCYVLEQEEADSAVSAEDFFNGDEYKFETETELTSSDLYFDNTKQIFSHGFSFYMMENRKSTPEEGKDSPGAWEYQHRDTRSGSSFTYVNDLATYVIIKARIISHTPRPSGTEVDIEWAEVKYVIHLGDFGKDLNNFDIFRNHTYTYNIVIAGINDISSYVTVDDSAAAEPGASGEIVVPLKKLYTCDSHYSTIAIDFYSDDIDENRMDWWVQTPFNKEGAGSGTEDKSKVDYKWVEFRINSDQRNNDSGKTYKAKTWTKYKPHSSSPVPPEHFKYIVNPSFEENPYFDPDDLSPTSPTLYIDELMAFLKAAKRGDIDTEGGKPIFDGNKMITVTAFVNENYYEQDPVGSGVEGSNLWRAFVNQPIRTMAIFTADKQRGESRWVQADYIIQQHSIQTPYNVNSSDIHSAWGAEYGVDAREHKSEGGYSGNVTGFPDDRKNTDTDNGRRNSMIEWGLMGADPENYSFVEDIRWDKYLTLTVNDETKNYFRSPYDKIRHSCLSRNRDNDGDGKIDKDEVRWYLATSNQLISLFLGAYGLEANTGLYQRTEKERNTNDASVWRQHVMASNRGSDYLLTQAGRSTPFKSNENVRVVWAEEGFTGSWSYVNQENGKLTGRCMRNLGYANDADITFADEGIVPDDLIVVNRYHEEGGAPYTGNWADGEYNDVYFDIDCSRVNEKSLRYYTDRELAPHDEHAEAACLYKRFRTTSINSSKTFSDKNVKNMNTEIDKLVSPVNPYCPDGYRLPNVRELAIMCYYLTMTENEAEVFICVDNNKKYLSFARTTYSFGNGGKGFQPDHWGWAIGKTDNRFRALKSNSNNTKSIRCVKDIKVE